MSKGKEIELAKVMDSFTNVDPMQLTNEQRILISEAVLALQEQKAFDEVDITSEYLELEKGDMMTCLFLGMTTMKADGKESDVIKVLSVKDQKQYIAANAMLVGNIKDLKPMTPLVITMTGEKQVNEGKGKYYTYSISLLVPKRK